MAGQKSKTTNRTLLEAFQALSVIAGTSWADPRVALRIGRSFRAVRKADDEIEKDRAVLLDQYAVRTDEGSYATGEGGGILLKDPLAFNKQWRELLDEEVELEVWPVDVSALADGKAKKGNCKECHRALGPNLSPFYLEVLVEIGVVVGADDQEAVTPAGE